MDIEVCKNPSSTDVELIMTGLKEFNKAFGTEDNHNQVGIFVRDIFLDTFSFQCTEFYESLGFDCFGCLRNYPKQGISKLFYHATIS